MMKKIISIFEKKISSTIDRKIRENYLGEKSNLSPSRKFQKQTRFDELKRIDSPLIQKGVSKKEKKISGRIMR